MTAARRAAAWPFTRPYQLILNLAVGGDWGGSKGIDDKALPATITLAAQARASVADRSWTEAVTDLVDRQRQRGAIAAGEAGDPVGQGDAGRAGLGLQLDIRAVLWAEVEAWANELLHDVHALASAYGWSESDVVRLSPWRREWYRQAVGW